MATILVVASVVGAGLIAAGQVRAGVATAVVALGLQLWCCALLLTRVEWSQRTHHRSLVERMGQVTGEARPSVGKPAAPKRADAVIGRAAAASPVDTPRDELLTHFGGTPGASVRARPVVAGIVTPELAAVLGPTVDLVELRPWLITRSLADARPNALVLEEAALRSGVWHGTETSAGLALFAELDAALTWCARSNVPILGVRSDEVGGPNTPFIRERFGMAFPTTEDLRPEGAPAQPLLEALQQYSTAHDGRPRAVEA